MSLWRYRRRLIIYDKAPQPPIIAKISSSPSFPLLLISVVHMFSHGKKRLSGRIDIMDNIYSIFKGYSVTTILLIPWLDGHIVLQITLSIHVNISSTICPNFSLSVAIVNISTIYLSSMCTMSVSSIMSSILFASLM